MKTFLFIIGGIMFGASALGIFSCKPVDTQSLKEELMEYLTSKPGGWDLSSINVPPNSATVPDDWQDFKLEVLPNRMNTNGHAPGATPVWPSGDWELAENGKTIVRGDGVVMNVRELTATRFQLAFVFSGDSDGGGNTDGRIASLNGDYVFDLK